MSDGPAPFRAGYVSIAGRPNAGKSTLLNALIGEKLAITARQAQTTRTSIQGVLTLPNAQIVFIDTPGIHKSDTLFNKRMMATVRRALEDRDLVLYVVDSSKPIAVEDGDAVSVLKRAKQTILVLNKIDRLEDKRLLLPLIAQYLELYGFLEAIPVSARKGDGLDDLTQTIVKYLPEGAAVFPEECFTDQPMRFLAGEIIREKILRDAQREVPHAVAVVVDEWKETPALTRICASIHVERPGQKKILIGKNGDMLKRIGAAARTEIEAMIGNKVFLSLFVKVRRNWREDPAFLDEIDWRAMVGSE
ncbi:MAG: GTPase Era [Bryobacteraceae bacterium]